jgi:hypothetical protein
MLWTRIQTGTLFLVVVAVLLAVGCTGSDPLTPQTGELLVALSGTNIGGRFVDSSNDEAVTLVSQFNVRPVDPQASEALGTDDLGLLLSATGLNFVEAATAEAKNRGLTSGVYRVTVLDVNIYLFTDGDPLDLDNFSDPISPSCRDFVRSYNPDLGGSSIGLTNFGAEITRTIDFNNPSSITAVFDQQAYLAAIEAAMPCDPNCPCVTNWDPMNPDLDCVCATESDIPNSGVLNDLAPTYLSFQ